MKNKKFKADRESNFNPVFTQHTHEHHLIYWVCDPDCKKPTKTKKKQRKRQNKTKQNKNIELNLRFSVFLFAANQAHLTYWLHFRAWKRIAIPLKLPFCDHRFQETYFTLWFYLAEPDRKRDRELAKDLFPVCKTVFDPSLKRKLRNVSKKVQSQIYRS